MAKQRINKEDIAPKGLFDNVTQGAKEAKSQVDILTQALKILKESAKNIKVNLENSKVNDTKGMKDFDELTRRSNETAKAKLNIDKQLLVEQQKLRIANADNTKAMKTEAEATTQLTNAQQKELGTLQKLELNNRQLRAERAKLNLETAEGTARMKEINKQLDINNQKIKESGDSMKQQKMNVGNYSSAIGKLQGMLGQLGLAFGAFDLLRGAGQTVAVFDQNIQDLSAITGASGKDLEFFRDNAIALGKGVEGGASAVVEAYKLIGSAKPELLTNAKALDEVTKSAITLSQASGMTLPDSAIALTDAMNQFGAGADKANQFINVLANGAKFGAAEIPQVTEALLKFGSVAKIANVTIEESTALIELLGEKGVKGAEAGTALRNVMLKLSAGDALPKEAQKRLEQYGISMEKLKDTTIPFSDRLKLLKPLLSDAGALTKIFGTENVVAATNLINGTERIDELTKSMHTMGTAQEQANLRTDTLSFAFNSLKETWNSWILAMSEGNGVGEELKDMLKFLAENLVTILNTGLKLLEFWISYKTVTIATTLANKLMASGFMQTAKSAGVLQTAVQGVGKVVGKVGDFLKKNVFGLIVVMVAELVREYSNLNEIYDKIKTNQDDLNKASKEVQNNSKKEQKEANNLFEALKETNAGSKERANLIDTINAKYGTTLKNLKDETAFQKALANEQRKVINNIKEKSKLEGARVKFEMSQAQFAEAEMANQKAFDALMAFQNAGAGSQAFSNFFEFFGASGEGELLRIKQASGELLDSTRKSAKKYEDEWNAMQIKIASDTKNETEKSGDQTEKTATETADKIISLKREIEDENIKQIQNEEQREKDQLITSAERRKEDTDKLNASLTEKATLKLEIEDTLQIDLLELERKYQDIYNKETKEFLEFQTKLKEDAIERDALLTKFAHEQDLEAQDEELQMIEEMYAESLARKHLELLQSSLTDEEVQKQMADYEIEQLKKRIEMYKTLYPEMTDKILELETDLAQKRRDLNNQANEDLKDDMKKRYQIMNDALDVSQDYFMQLADKRIAKLDEEIEKHKANASTLQELAKNGNILASQSLAEENRLLAESEAKKEKLERRKQQLLTITSILKAYNTNMESGDKSGVALTKAITSKAVLDQFIASLGSFFDGTEDTGSVSNPLDSNGGRLAILHNNERVITAKQNKKIGSYSNEEVASIVENHRINKTIDGNQINVGFGNELLVQELMDVKSKLDQVNSTIKNKPEVNISMGEIVQGVMTIIDSRKENGKLVYNRFKFKA